MENKKLASQNDVLLKALKSVYSVLDLNSYNLWREHQILKSCSSFTRRRVKALTIVPLTDGTASGKNETDLHRYLNRNDGVGPLFLPFKEDR